MVQCKKQPIVQLEPYPCVNSTVDHGTYKIQFPCATLPSHRHLVVKVPVVSLGMAFTGLHPLLTSDVIPSSNFLKLSAKKNTLLAVVVKHSQYMYNSFPALCRNTAGSNCILILSNLTAGIHVYINYEGNLENNFQYKCIFKFVWLVGTVWQLCETSEFRVVCGETNANSTCLHAEIDRDGPESSRKVIFWIDPGVRSMSAFK